MSEKIEKINELMNVIFSLRQLIEKFYKERYKENFSPLRMITLHFVMAKKDPLMKDIADFLSITPASATSLIDGMVRDKILIRLLDKKDRRIVRLKITKKGEDIFSDGHKFMGTQMRKVICCLNKSEVKQLVKIYKKVFKTFNAKK